MISRRDFLRVTTAAALGSQIARLRQDVRAYAREVEAPAATPPAARTPLGLAAELGLVLDPWQERALATDCHHRVLLVTRQGGKGVVASLLAIDQALSVPGSKTLIGARTEEQAKRLFGRIKSSYLALRGAPLLVTSKAVEMQLITGRQALFSTARGKRGFFWEMYSGLPPEWYRDKVVCYDIPRIKRSFLERERRDMGQWLFEQEYLCEFKDAEDQYFPTAFVHAALAPSLAPFLAGFGGAA
jgi:hypothetical protein